MADRILADPSKRKLFEKENLYNLLELPKQKASPADQTRFKQSPEGGTNSAIKNTDTTDSPEEDGVFIEPRQKAQKPMKLRKLNQKAIRKDKRYRDFEER